LRYQLGGDGGGLVVLRVDVDCSRFVGGGAFGGGPACTAWLVGY
jgi:hypothetical protein